MPSVPLVKLNVPFLTIDPVLNVPPLRVSVWNALIVVVPLTERDLGESMERLAPRVPPVPTVRLGPKLSEPELKLRAPPELTARFPSAAVASVMLSTPPELMVVPAVAGTVKDAPLRTFMVLAPVDELRIRS